jgi:hypothetical protein
MRSGFRLNGVAMRPSTGAANRRFNISRSNHLVACRVSGDTSWSSPHRPGDAGLPRVLCEI